MRPIKLILKGFRGIRDGLGLTELSLDFELVGSGAQLIALVGPNGCGKTTIIDNSQPYRVMPSRATSASVGGFSYYDHLCAPEACKDLEWVHAGRRFRSQLIFRLNGARRTEAFLHEWKNDRWVPVVAPDGTRSDGKTDTYDRCVESLLGSPETFFTSAFHAQNRRQLSAYRPSEVKSLLVELLDLEQIRATGQNAGRVAARLQQALDQCRANLSRHRAAEQSIKQLRAAIEQAEAAIGRAGNARTTAQSNLQAAQRQLAVCEADRACAAGTEALRQSVLAQKGDQERRKTVANGVLARLCGELRARRDRAASALREAESSATTARHRHQRDSAGARELLAKRDAIHSAVEQLPKLAEHEQAARQELRAAEDLWESCSRVRRRLDVIAARRQGLEREAGAAALRAQQLRERFGLTQEVPCSGMNLQTACKLLADAREAQRLQPSADLKIEKLQQEVSALDLERDRLMRDLAVAGDANDRLARARTVLDSMLERRRLVMADAALAEQLVGAEIRLLDMAAEAALIEQRLRTAEATTREELMRCDVAEREAAQRHDAEIADAEANLLSLAQRLAGMQPPFDDGKHAAAERAVRGALQALVDADAAHMAAVTHRAELCGRLQSTMVDADQGGAAEKAISHLETELAMWTALAKALGNDGVIALCIDDAGPTLASLANELLLACYGPRFTVSITTQVETVRKDVKEGFDVIVFDAETGDSKSMSMMSGGERVWIDEALTRAIAIYLSQSAGRRYQTLFSDEADGPLDPERKRMFLAMKREVLRLGGYEMEIFVSQTIELWSLADRVIDLTHLQATPADQGRALTI